LEIKNGVLSCECLDDVYYGIPCRHEMAAVCMIKEITLEDLPFLPRWRKDYFKGEKKEDLITILLLPKKEKVKKL